MFISPKISTQKGLFSRCLLAGGKNGQPFTTRWHFLGIYRYFSPFSLFFYCHIRHKMLALLLCGIHKWHKMLDLLLSGNHKWYKMMVLLLCGIHKWHKMLALPLCGGRQVYNTVFIVISERQSLHPP